MNVQEPIDAGQSNFGILTGSSYTIGIKTIKKWPGSIP